MARWLLLALLLSTVWLTACDADDDDSSDDDDATEPTVCAWGLAAACADEVVDAPGSTGIALGDPTRATNGVRGEGDGGGSVDVYSLDLTARDSLTLRWSGRVVVDGPGVDLVVFENAFVKNTPGAGFLEPAIVEVSTDGVEWVAFPHDYLAPDETAYSNLLADWMGFAGLSPARLHEEDNPVDPLDPVAAGGDGFDLADLPGPAGDAVRADGARFLRLRNALTATNPDSGVPYPGDATAAGADIDGVYAAVLVEDPRR